MPFYKIMVLLRPTSYPGTPREISVIRYLKETDIDKVWHMLDIKSREKWAEAVKDFDCVQISKRSADYQVYLKQEAGKKGATNSQEFSDIPPAAVLEPGKPSDWGKYRNKKE
ncbi:hypothetical protein ACX0G9_19030 [Flavitalea flava]